MDRVCTNPIVWERSCGSGEEEERREVAKGLYCDRLKAFDGANNNTKRVPCPHHVPDTVPNTSFILLCLNPTTTQ